MNKVTNLFGPHSRARGQVDPELSFELGAVRELLGANTREPQFKSHEVVLSEGNGELPYTLPNGTMEIYRDGLQTFNETFGDFTDKTKTLLVVYAGARRVIEDRRDEFTGFHDHLLGAARRKEQHWPEKYMPIHKAEAMLIGWVAASMAAIRVSKFKVTRSEKDRLPAQLQSSAMERLLRNGSLTRDQYAVLNHFGSLPPGRMDLTKEVIRACKSLPKAAIIDED